jgi:hypothetical protein
LFSMTERPEESYPLYSNRFRPSMSRVPIPLEPTYPTIPHMLGNYLFLMGLQSLTIASF